MKHPLEEIPGVGPQIAAHMAALGLCQVSDLVGQDPEDLFRRDCARKGYQEDLCALYLWRAAVYYAEHPVREPQKLKWWYWKDHVYPPQKEGNL